MSLSLHTLNHDILIYIFTALSIPDILVLRQVSRRLYLISEQYAVWNAACTSEILGNGIPFPNRPLASFSAKDLERQTLRAYKLGLNWRSPTTTLYHVISTPIKLGAIEEIKFLSRSSGKSWIITTSISIWWTLCIRDCDSLRVVAQWNPGKALFNGIAVNSDDQSDAAIAISVHGAGWTVELFNISEDGAGGATIHHRGTLNTSSKPVALNGDTIALCDHDSETMILNWKTQEQALLKSPGTWQDKPLHVAFANGSIFVVRARSICIFDEPQMVLPGDNLNVSLPRVFRSFGWVDGVALALGSSAPRSPACSSHLPLSLLVRYKGGDPWRPTEEFQFMTLNSDFNNTSGGHFLDTSSTGHESFPFPFSSIASLSSRHRGPLRCSDIVLGSYGTAVWIQPSDWAAAGLITDENFMEHVNTAVSRETLVIALFPGPLNQGSSYAHVKVVLEGNESGWSCLDYNETQGLIALGSGSGAVTVYRL